MTNRKKDDVISEANQHTIKKFDLIEAYVKEWAPKLLNNKSCENLVFIDCMCNSGEYIEKSTRNKVFGTPIRVTRVLSAFAEKYPSKKISVYYNDNSEEKIKHLKQLVKDASAKLTLFFSVKDANLLLKELAAKITNHKSTNYLLVYDPYEASIDWSAIIPYINNWGEVIINHMLSDPARAIRVVKRDQSVKKYESTYLTNIENLMPYGSDKKAYEKQIEEIISKLHTNRQYYVAAFPFFNGRNSIVYDLIHCTNNIAGFKLYKKVAWKTFGGKSSTLNTHGQEEQMMIDFDDDGNLKTRTFEDCYYVKDIAEYLQNHFQGQNNIQLSALWNLLDKHPIFPSDGFRNEIKQILKNHFDAVIKNNTISFKRSKQ